MPTAQGDISDLATKVEVLEILVRQLVAETRRLDPANRSAFIHAQTKIRDSEHASEHDSDVAYEVVEVLAS